jgi:exopolysaccharide biosynthesis polyprenyl glycosylphosphotransferase
MSTIEKEYARTEVKAGLIDLESIPNRRTQHKFERSISVFKSYRVLAVILDLIFYVSAFSMLGVLLNPVNGGLPWTLYFVACTCSCFIPVIVVGGYSQSVVKTSARFLSEHVIASSLSWITLLGGLSAIVVFNSGLHLKDLYLHGLLVGVGYTISSIVVKRLLHQFRISQHSYKTLLIVGANDQSRELYTLQLEKGDLRDIRIVDFDAERSGKRLIPDDHKSPIVEIANEETLFSNPDIIETIVVTSKLSNIPPKFVNQLMAINLLDYKVESLGRFLSREHKIISTSNLDSAWFFDGGFMLLENTVYYRLKRIVDFAVSAVALAILTPVFLLISIAIKLSNKGPIFFKQDRVGVCGEIFTLYKFRTMTKGSEKGPIYTQVNDSRITKLGSALRSTRLDELPQLLNVLKGEMSLVGPRAEWTRCVELYEKNIPFYHYRHLVKPGISGWAQVNYPYGASEEDAIEKLKYDLFYVRHFSLTLDFSIFVKTLYVMLKKEGGR